jgi:hypothetical protein
LPSSLRSAHSPLSETILMGFTLHYRGRSCNEKVGSRQVSSFFAFFAAFVFRNSIEQKVG